MSIRTILLKVKYFLDFYVGPTGFAYRPIYHLMNRHQYLAKGTLYDIGCGKKPFKKIFKSVSNYIGVDWSGNSEADYVCDFLNNGLPDRVADSLLSTQVIEHVKDPQKFVAELARISKSGSVCLLTAPLFARIHGQPHDYFRFTRYGLHYLLSTNGFNVQSITEIGGYFFTSTYLLTFFIKEKIGVISYLINPLFFMLYYTIRWLDKDKNHPAFYFVVCTRN